MGKAPQSWEWGANNVGRLEEKKRKCGETSGESRQVHNVAIML